MTRAVARLTRRPFHVVRVLTAPHDGGTVCAALAHAVRAGWSDEDPTFDVHVTVTLMWSGKSPRSLNTPATNGHQKLWCVVRQILTSECSAFHRSQTMPGLFSA